MTPAVRNCLSMEGTEDFNLVNIFLDILQLVAIGSAALVLYGKYPEEWTSWMVWEGMRWKYTKRLFIAIGITSGAVALLGEFRLLVAFLLFG